MKLLGASLVKCRYLTSFSISSNPIGDWGLYYILKLFMNRHRNIYKHYPKPSRIHCLLPDEPAIDMEMYSQMLPSSTPASPIRPTFSWLHIYPPRQLPGPIFLPSTKFTFVIVKESNGRKASPQFDDEAPVRFPNSNQKSVVFQKRDAYDSEDSEYEDDDDIDDEQAIISVSSHFNETLQSKISDDNRGLDDLNEDQFHAYFNRSLSMKDDKLVILPLFRSKRHAVNKNRYDEIHRDILADDNQVEDTEQDGNKAQYETEDEFSMSEE